MKTCTDNIVSSLKHKKVNRVMYIALFILMVAELVLVLMPVVELKSALFQIEKGFSFFDFGNGKLLRLVVIVLHLVSIIVLCIPMVTKYEFLGRFYVPAMLTSAMACIMFIRLTLVIDNLVVDSPLGELLQYVTEGPYLTVTSKGLIAVSTIAFLISTGMALSAGSTVTEPEQK